MLSTGAGLNQELLLAAKLSRRYVMQGLPVHATTHYLVSNMHHPLQLGGKLAARTVSKGPWNGRSRDGDVTVKVNIAGDASLRSCWQRAVGTQLRNSSCSGSDISGYVWLGIACLMQPLKGGGKTLQSQPKPATTHLLVVSRGGWAACAFFLNLELHGEVRHCAQARE